MWRAFGDVPNYVEPFFGSGAVLLGRPGEPRTETINDLDGYVANFWRAIKGDPQGVAQWADSTVNESDLTARHIWLVERREMLRAKLAGDAEWFDAKVAGWWVWGICCWIGSEFCSGKGPWWIDEDRQLVHLGNAGRGVNRKLVHLGDAGRGVNRQLVHLGSAGQGVKRQLVHLGDGRGAALQEWFGALASRMRRVRVASGDWSRVVTNSVTRVHGLTGVFLDPPYDDGAIDYVSGSRVSADVRAWAVDNGDDPMLRIALCGYDGEHEMPKSWTEHAWKAQGGFGSQRRTGKTKNENSRRERIWFSPHCLPIQEQTSMSGTE